jgi:TonB family protein
LGPALLLSAVLHAVLLLLFIPGLIDDTDVEDLEVAAPPEPEHVEFQMTILPEPERPGQQEQPVQALEEWAEQQAQEEEQAHEEDEERESAPEQPPEPNMYMVDLASEEEDVPPPPDTQYLAQDNNRAVVETQAELTTLLETERGQEMAEAAPSEEPPIPDAQEPTEVDETETDAAETSAAVQLAAARIENPRAASRNPNVVGDGPRRIDLSAFTPNLAMYQASMAERDLDHRTRIARSMRADGYLGGDDQAEWERMRAALENMVPEVRSGTETHLNTRRHAYAPYIAYVHRRIHARWAEDYLLSLDRRFDPSDPLSSRDLETVIEVVISRAGNIARVNLVRTSGQLMFDAEAMDTIHRIGPLRPPPSAIVSSNGNAYIHWSFWRDQRMCGTFGATVRQLR